MSPGKTISWNFLLVLLMVAWTSTDTLANNHHEHFSSLPFPKNFLAAGDALDEAQVLWEALGGTKGTSDADGLKKAEKNLREILTEQLGFDSTTRQYQEALRVLRRKRKGMELGDLLAIINPYNKAAALNQLLAIDRRSLNKDQAKRAYTHAELIRGELIKVVDIEAVVKIYDAYFRSDKKNEHKVLGITVNGGLSEGAGKQKLIEVRKLATQKYGSELRYFYSVGRRRLLDNPDDPQHMQRILKSINKQLDNGGIYKGIDLTGSMFENTRKLPPGLTQQIANERLLAVFKAASDHEVPLRLHAFEAMNSGIFYEALKHALDNFEGKITLGVGHIAELNQDWVDRLAKFQEKHPDSKIIVEANVGSNMLLQGKKNEDLAEAVIRAKKAELTVVAGADGRGLLGEHSRFENQQFLIEFTDAADAAEKVTGDKSLTTFDTLHSSGETDCGGLAKLK